MHGGLGAVERGGVGGEQRRSQEECRGAKGVRQPADPSAFGRSLHQRAALHSYDDFEEVELHSTILIDRLGRVHWARNGGDPFGDLAFLEKQLGRMNQSQ
jgi:hypothetical protein